ncbi:MAG: chromosome segregation protein SMC [bacterium]|nr:chromosome segregation protein SMC [bacterium]
MRVTRLEIFGFKSFRERFVLNFDKALVGIVGPNGCGKSNIIDALRWVLGETQAKQLRGGVQEDLIFNGTDEHKPLGMAEVSITLRADKGWAPAVEVEEFELPDEGSDENVSAISPESDVSESISGDQESQEKQIQKKQAKSFVEALPGLFAAEEVQLTRRLYRSGESEYFINQVPCRLRDMTEFYRMIGLGSRGLSIVQQGTIGQIVTRKPVERRELLEEAAGISGFRTRIEAATRQLERTSENMDRLRDIITEVDKQVKILKRQAARARSRQELKETLRIRDFELFNAKVASVNLKRATAMRESTETEKELEALSSTLEELRTGLEEKRLRAEELDVSASGFHSSRTTNSAEMETITQQLEALGARRQQAELEITRRRGQVEALGREAQKLSQESEQKLKDAELKEFARSSAQLELSQAQEKRMQLEKGLEEIALETKSKLEALQVAAQTEAQDSAPEEHPEVKRLAAVAEERPGIEERLESLEQDIRSQRKSVTEAREERSRADARLAGVRSEISSLRKQIESFREHAEKSTGTNSEQDSIQANILLAGLSVPAELEKSVAAVIGQASHYLVSDDAWNILEGASSRMQNRSLKAGAILASGSRTASSLRQRLQGILAGREDARLLLDCLVVESWAQLAAEAMLGDVILVDTAVEAVQIRSLVGDEPCRILCRSGEMLAHWGWQTTEGKGPELGLKRHLGEAEARLENCEGESARLVEQLRIREEQLIVQEEERVSLKERQGVCSNAERELRIMLRELNEAATRRIQEQRNREREEREKLLNVERMAQREVRDAVSRVATLSSRVDFEARRRDELKEESERLLQRREQVIERQAAAEGDLAVAEKALAEFSESGESGEQGLRLQQCREELREIMREIDRELRELDVRRSESRQEHTVIQRSLDGERAKHEKLQGNLNRLGLLVERSQVELEHLTEDFNRYYPEDTLALDEAAVEQFLQELTEPLEQVLRKAAAESDQLRKRLEREGEVDPESIEKFEQESSRLENLERQLADLEKASETLRKTIRHLKEVSRQRFMETFEFVRDKFADLIPRLFGGGMGRMELVDSDDVLSCGIELVVRPPGKKLRTLELLSGGEKALSAVGILMAMFLHRPSPICVMDEVDAPLDDANLERFLGVIREISRNTQFLVVTHNKQTMVEADRLVGITMQKKGVSTALAVDLETMEQEVEKWVANA